MLKGDQILHGSLMETRYSWPDRNTVDEGKPSPPQILKETTYGRDQVTYMSDKVSEPWCARFLLSY